ncbi:GIY-YIG nuclease family protein [Brevundimonas variabilis]|uniref:Bacteriophage T5 Orf172 DNA-binding domain-containing protein n=1 Tax=Brevundimonas variabilis TaxID=74312 RepID=A0A7W9CKV1_9CAUL|nr:GIY-YIG nuclease family protein [Brevundimonas variabilis]MBB5747062.1 hypothetical protein [Brevundimonas variabilis]
MQPDDNPRRRNPDWTEDETLLALEAYLRLRPKSARPDLDVIIELSQFLQLYGRLRGIDAGPTFRNVDGVSRKVFKLSASERGEAPDTVRGAELERTIWIRYDGDPERVIEAAEALRLAIYDTAARQDLNAREGPIAPNAADTEDKPSRGPAPVFGERTVVIEDSDCVVYVHVLEGAVAPLFDALPDGDDVLKIGRSNAPHRRLRQLNAGFPPAMGFRWSLLAVKPFADAQSAHDAEQALLLRLYGEARSLGGEFVKAPRASVKTWFD